MGLNPEFRRQLWCELSPFRLVAMPVLLGFVGVFAYALGDKSGEWNRENSVAWVASVAFGLLILPWGARLAADGLAAEFRDRTWDAQRMTSLAPWSMAWGKLLGGPILAWYGAAVCIAMYLFTAPLPTSPRLAGAAWGVVAGLFLHACVLLWTLLALRKRGRSPSREIGLSTLLGLIALPPFWALGSFVTAEHFPPLEWFGTRYVGTYFVLVAGALFAGWAVLAFYRTMRAELGLRNLPWTWLGFVLFAMVFAAGFAESDPDSRVFPLAWTRWRVAYAVAVAAVYVVAFAEPVDWVRARRVAGAWRRRDLVGCLGEVPRWPLSFAIAVAVALLWIAWLSATSTERIAGPIAGILAVAAFVVRDMALRLSLHASPTPRRRADGAMLVLLAVLYLLIPWTLEALDASPWLLCTYWPGGGYFGFDAADRVSPLIILGIPLAEAAAACWFAAVVARGKRRPMVGARSPV